MAATWRPKLNALVAEYLSDVGLSESVAVFEAECKLKGETIGSVPCNSGPRNIQEEFMVAFGCGEREAFFDMWEEFVPSMVRMNDTVGRDLEFSVCVHFALYPLKYQVGDASRAMDMFKSYLSSKGSVLAQCQEFAVYCALPYIPDPSSHASFSHLFTESWTSELKERLQQFLTTVLPLSQSSPVKPRLAQVYLQSQESPRKAVSKERALEKKLENITEGYDTLAGISIELIEAMEATVSGEPVQPEFIQNMISRLCSTIPTVSGSYSWLNEPLTANKVEQTDMSKLRESVMSLTHSVHTPLPDVPWEDYQLLDYTHLKQDLLILSNRTKALLLQALRWRVTRSLPGRQRQLIIYHYTTNDFLGLTPGTGQTIINSFFSTEDQFLWEQTCRMLNALSSLTKGRDYLQNCSSLVPTLCAVLSSQKGDGQLCRNALGTVQKLSLRRMLQSHMIREGLVGWVIDLLSEGDSLSDYTLRYSLALLMNLCLRTAGKRHCVQLSPRPLHVLSELLEHEETEIRSYVNGILYSMLGVTELRDTALSMGIVDMLQSAVSDSPPELQSQLRYIIEDRIHSNTVQPLPEVDSDDDGDEDEEQEDPEMVEGDDGEDAVSGDEPVGEQLLAKYYMETLGDRPRTSSERSQSALSLVPFMRPVTPQSIGTTTIIISSTPKPHPTSKKETTAAAGTDSGGSGGEEKEEEEGDVLRESSAPLSSRTYTRSRTSNRSRDEDRPRTAE